MTSRMKLTSRARCWSRSLRVSRIAVGQRTVLGQAPPRLPPPVQEIVQQHEPDQRGNGEEIEQPHVVEDAVAFSRRQRRGLARWRISCRRRGGTCRKSEAGWPWQSSSADRWKAGCCARRGNLRSWPRSARPSWLPARDSCSSNLKPVPLAGQSVHSAFDPRGSASRSSARRSPHTPAKAGPWAPGYCAHRDSRCRWGPPPRRRRRHGRVCSPCKRRRPAHGTWRRSKPPAAWKSASAGQTRAECCVRRGNRCRPQHSSCPRGQRVHEHSPGKLPQAWRR